MAHWEDDACSDSSWLIASSETQSESSWLLEGNTADVQLQQPDSDLHSNLSWEILSDRDQCMTPRDDCPALTRKVEINDLLSPEINTSSLISLIRAGRADVALRLLRSSPELAKVVEDEDTALSWAVYKAKHQSIAWLELVCELLIHAPADVKKKNWCQFLPLHDAAWGNAPAAVGIVLCAQFPSAMQTRGHGCMPIELGHYHHTTSRCAFSWPEQDKMMSAASALAEETDFLKTVTALRLSSFDQEMLRSMSSAELQSHFEIGQPVAELIRSFLTPPRARAPKWASTLPQIPESKMLRCIIRTSEVADETVACAKENALPELACDDLFAREDSAKNTSLYAGVRRARNARCSFRSLMVVSDSHGGRFFLSTHSVRAMPEEQGRKERKWPSKVNLTLERKKDRAFKNAIMWA